MRRRDVILKEMDGVIKENSDKDGAVDADFAAAIRQQAMLEVLLDIRDLLAPKEEKEDGK